MWQLGALHRIESEDVVNAVVRYASGATGVIQASTAFWPGYPERTEFHGTKGTAVISGDKLTTWDVENDARRTGAGGAGSGLRRVRPHGHLARTVRAAVPRFRRGHRAGPPAAGRRRGRLRRRWNWWTRCTARAERARRSCWGSAVAALWRAGAIARGIGCPKAHVILNYPSEASDAEHQLYDSPWHRGHPRRVQGQFARPATLTARSRPPPRHLSFLGIRVSREILALGYRVGVPATRNRVLRPASGVSPAE